MYVYCISVIFTLLRLRNLHLTLITDSGLELPSAYPSISNFDGSIDIAMFDCFTYCDELLLFPIKNCFRRREKNTSDKNHLLISKDCSL